MTIEQEKIPDSVSEKSERVKIKLIMTAQIILV